MARFFLGTLTASVRKRVVDDFNRTVANIGKALDGSSWTINRGVWATTGSVLTSVDAPSSYPIITQDFPFQNVQLTVNEPTNGIASVLWLTDNGNWWAVGTEQQAVNCNCSNYSYCSSTGCTSTGCTGYGCTSSGCCAAGCTSTGCTGYGCTGYGCTGSACTSYGCTGYGCSSYGCTSSGCAYRVGSYCVAYGCLASGCTSSGCTSTGCTGYGCGGYGCNATGCTSSGCTGYGCTSSGCCATGCTSSGCTGYGCTGYATGTTCQTCYPSYIRVLQSAANAVSTVTSWSISQVVSAFKVLTTGNSITVKAYTDAAATTQLGTDVSYTATGAALTKRYGLTVTPASYNQGSTVSGIEIKDN